MEDKWKVVLLGDGGVGKTALCWQFVRGRFTYDPTIEDSFRKHTLVDTQMCALEIFDTAGHDFAVPLREECMRMGDGFVLVYSVDSRRSFEQIRGFYEDIGRVKHPSNPVFILVANKMDMRNEIQVSHGEGLQLAAQYNCQFVETTAKSQKCTSLHPQPESSLWSECTGCVVT
ncbi:hypothetical protein M422DRAFT_61521 [Sphaerobolus stellatus SS14]|uniref:Small monomeric GTPase n=1 Tax=Sphaerobolus stellatus (strain SS14) TaxID=990650 RepID=A0A0C9UU18_SPHS4|nr:hypothetical protein M422DRAFT_61521 [Sphaerobolus stellatus SS14]